MIVVEPNGNCHVGVITGDAEEPDSVVSLSRDLAVAVAALLTGARVSIDSTADDRFDADEITVETVALAAGHRRSDGSSKRCRFQREAAPPSSP
jgi:hypothetical protein